MVATLGIAIALLITASGIPLITACFKEVPSQNFKISAIASVDMRNMITPEANALLTVGISSFVRCKSRLASSTINISPNVPISSSED